jgi:hypothetical protein
MDVLGRLAPGEAVKTAPVAKALTGLDGSFALRVDPKVAIQQFTEDNGTVNFSLVGEGAGSKAVFDFPRRLDGLLGAWVDPDWSPDRGVAQLVTIRLKLDGPAVAPPGAVPAPRLVYKDGICPNVPIEDYYPFHTNGEAYPGPNASAQFSYMVNASNTIGVGYSVSGNYGSFSQSGTVGTTATVTAQYPVATAGQLMVTRTSWKYTKFAIYNFYEFYGCLLDYYSVRPVQYWGANDYFFIGSLPFAPQGCAYQGAGMVITKDSGTAVTFSDGIALSAYIGISVSSQTGFTQNTKIQFTFGPPGYLCGDTAAGYVGSGRLAGL